MRDYKRTIIATELIYAVALLATGLINVRQKSCLWLFWRLSLCLLRLHKTLLQTRLPSFLLRSTTIVCSIVMQSMGAFGGAAIWWRSLAYLTEKLWLECSSTLLSLVCLYDDYCPVSERMRTVLPAPLCPMMRFVFPSSKRCLYPSALLVAE